MRLNNPIYEVLNEASRLYPKASIGCVVSLGTGWTDVTELDHSRVNFTSVIKTCVDLALNANNVAQQFLRDDRGTKMLESKSYFRFDVERGLDTIALDEFKKLDVIDALTQKYLARPDGKARLVDCVKALTGDTSNDC